MADERDRWLDEAAAEAFLRGGPTEPVGPAADTRAAMEAARLRAALDALAAMAAPAPLGTELPGEGVAVDAYRAARGAVRPAAVPSAADGSGEPLVDLGRVFPAPAPVPARRRARTVSFGLAAALASVAAGGLAAAAGAGLLDRSRHDTAGPGPAMSVSAGESPVPGVGTSAPTLTPKLRPTPLPDGSDPAFAPVTPSPGPDGRTTPGTAAGPDTSTGTTTTGGGAGKGLQDDRSGQGDREGSRDTLGTGELGKDRQREQDSRLKADLCQEYRKGRLNEDRRERLTRLADGLLRIPAYCASVLDGESDGTKRRDAPLGGGTLRAPSMSPAVPQGSTPLRVGP
ncbi:MULTISPECIES: hypothetical protein [Streptomyces]|uniref:Extensin n=1 Tax=Streptomyces virginiae TaxID=1961 RepID=A0ABQ3ND84_STRVG|nr:MULTISPECIES: hypothetical protein [Streptomyces]MBP2346039.1 hypothetical protein [Streptomyces virginiae]MCI4083311.1 hypothetical protein [Streptomyces sp. MMS21 TC-5]QNE25687.1 hypothetical protein F1D59_13620 [Streptomyces sp. INR7]RSS98113.1 hypothetical protein EF904_27500 [Streptomyces sp. WAC05950]GGQ28941.1 hypothetical protein GCM10010215_61460 [Streptomyces virginiae]